MENDNLINNEELVDPWTVQGAIVDGKLQPINYENLIQKFGTKEVTPELLERFEKVTGRKPHYFLRRGIFFSHRDLDQLLTRYEKKQPFYLYTGRGPSSESMHLGHFVPFMFCKYLQDVFDVPIVIQLTDDEKFLFKPDLSLEKCYHYALQNAKDIMACGFDPEKTFIFANTQYVGGAFYHNITRIAKAITCSASKACFGFNDSDNIGKLHFVSIQAAPSFSNSFPHIFGKRHDIPCLIPCAIDQDPYFRLTRDVAPKLGYPKPGLLHSKFFPALQGNQTKMSASLDHTAIFMSDTPETIASKINKYAFSGGKDSIEEHRKYGGDPDIDMAYQYLTFFMESDEELARLESSYRSGELLSGEMKKACIQVLTTLVSKFQTAKAAITDDFLFQVMDSSKPLPWALKHGYIDGLLSHMELLRLSSEPNLEENKNKK